MIEHEKRKPAKRSRGQQKPAKATRGRKKKAKLVEKVIQRMQEKLESDELKPSIGDFIRLLQLEKELAEEQPKEIKVSWVEPGEEKPVTGE